MTMEVTRFLFSQRTIKPKKNDDSSEESEFYRTDKGSTPTFHPRTEIRMANPHIKEPETQSALEDLNSNKGAGPDGLFPNTLTTLNPNIAPVLYAFLTSPSKLPRSLMTGATPPLP